MSSLGIFIFGLTAVTPVVSGDTLVRTVDEFNEAIRQVRPGDTIIIANGTWHDADLVFDADGLEGDSITVRAETPGSVVLTGRSRLRIGGSYLKVEGLWFHRGALEGGHVIAFRTDRAAHHSRITNCAVTEYNPANWLLQYKWLSLYGTHNRVDHCYFAGKTHDGATLVVWLEDPPNDTPNHHRIDHNHFGHRPVLGKNGGETIRIGTSHRSMQDSYTVVEHNLFERTDGEHEIISNKTGRNTFRHNTFREAKGALTLRHGNWATVTQNYFLGNGKPGTGGVRIIGEDHKVTHNYFADLQGDSSRATLSVMNGIPNSPLNRYFQVMRPVIAHNTFVRTRVSILFGLGADGEKSLVPTDVSFRDNVIFTDSDLPIVFAQVSPQDIMWSGNVFHGTVLGIPQPRGVQWENPGLSKSNDELWRPMPDGPAAGKGASLARPPLKRSDVGPSWWGLPWKPRILADPVHDVPVFSFAGYQWGEQPIPDYEPTLVVTDFGATGDDSNDDTNAFRLAFEAAHARSGLVVISIPKGRFHLSGILLLERDSLIVRGSGINETFIVIEKPLGAMDVPTSILQARDTDVEVRGRAASQFSEFGGVFWSRVPADPLAEPAIRIQGGERGTHAIRIPEVEAISIPGDVQVSWNSVGGTDSSRQRMQVVTVLSSDGNVVYTKEPLLSDLTPTMEPSIASLDYLNEVGIEHLTIEFEKVPYGGHLLEDGYNAIYLSQVRQGWVRSVEIKNSDAGIVLSESSQVTLEDVSSTGRAGHIGIQLTNSRNTLVRNFRMLSHAVHPVNCAGDSGYNVFTRGTLGSISETGCKHPNLYDHLTVYSNGEPAWEAEMRSAMVLWNLSVDYENIDAIRLPVYLGELGNGTTVVGLSSPVPVRIQAGPGAYLEGINRPPVLVPSLYLHQLHNRIGID